MAYDVLKQTVQTALPDNTENLISAADVRNSLIAVINSLGAEYQFGGGAEPTDNPGTPDYKVAYLASTPGTYTNFGGITLADGEIAILKYNGTWFKDTTGAVSQGAIDGLRSEMEQADNAPYAFANLARIAYNHIVDSADWTYKASSTFDVGWVRIFDASGKIVISGATPYRITFYNSATDPAPANKISSITASGISPTGNDIPAGTKLALINFRHVDNAGGYDDLRVTQPGAGATRKFVEESIANVAVSEMSIKKVVGKNLINPDDVLPGYRWSSDNGFEANANGILSNKLYLRPGKYTIQGVKAYSGDTARVLLFDDNDNFLNAGSAISLDANGVGVYEYKCTSDFFYAAYARIMLQYSTTRPFNPAVAQFERGESATAFEPCQTALFPNPAFGHEQKTIFLSGASIAMIANGWFENACERLGYKHRNVSVSGESIVNAANKLWRGTLFESLGSLAVDVLVLSHVHNYNVASTDSTGILAGTVAEYEAKGYAADGTLLDHAPDPDNPDEYLIAPGGGNTTERYAAGFDYVLKKWAEMCLAEKDDESSRWYGTKTGKPFSVIICSYWHDGRVTYNDAAKILAERHGALFCDFASQIGFSYKQTDPSDANSVRQSALYCNNSAFGGSNDTTTETINGVTYTGMGWHPTRDAQSYLVQRRGQILSEMLKIATGWD